MSPLSRRRFLTISAAALATPAIATPLRWQGHAMGARVSVVLHAPEDQAKPALDQLRQLLPRLERLFSLYDSNSDLSRLNRSGRLDAPHPDFVALLKQVGQVHSATSGLFDPTVQPLWLALARGEDPAPSRALLGWDRVQVSRQVVALEFGQALTLNGIAQGFATDMARQILQQSGLTRTLINIGEFAALGGPFRLGVEDPEFGLVATRTLENRAIATSSPSALTLSADQSHILHPNGKPRWSTVSVEADSAAIADAASTAFCLMSEPRIRDALRALPGTPKATLVDHHGDLKTLG
ncbi:FAD:protein FMN transferase [Ruegeria arenilitoris]|uniref:FAD:protein FMN transferase n=1 Tax=Ruegeria arenilitoris TaxID=1173585 RepID=UPI00147B35E9|nr:FAD:protein FMN transferase [Ruegeria arenilitoris]